jgi:hypothetical protein
MPDDKTKVGEPDRSRVSADQDYEVRYVADKFGLTVDQVKKLIAGVGYDRLKVEAAARRRGMPLSMVWIASSALAASNTMKPRRPIPSHRLLLLRLAQTCRSSRKKTALLRLFATQSDHRGSLCKPTKFSRLVVGNP